MLWKLYVGKYKKEIIIKALYITIQNPVEQNKQIKTNDIFYEEWTEKEKVKIIY